MNGYESSSSIYNKMSYVFIGDIKNPLDFDPHLVSVHNIIDPNYDGFSHIDFVRWRKDGLLVKFYENEEETFIPLNLLNQRLEEKRKHEL